MLFEFIKELPIRFLPIFILKRGTYIFSLFGRHNQKRCLCVILKNSEDEVFFQVRSKLDTPRLSIMNIRKVTF